MQPPLAVCVLIKSSQYKACLELSTDLFFQRMGELHTCILFLELFHLLRVAQRIERQLVDNLFLFSIYNVIDIVIHTGKQQPAGF